MRDAAPDTTIYRLLRNTDGVTSIEYAMIASGVSIAVLSGVTLLGDTINTVFYEKLMNLF